jgi:hypothetical protein
MPTGALPTIPVQPISYGDAQPLLSLLGVNSVPATWTKSGLNFKFMVGRKGEREKGIFHELQREERRKRKEGME